MRALSAALLCATFLVAAAPAQAQQEDWNAVVAAGKKEGQVLVYHAQLGAQHWKDVVKSFEAKYGIKVREYDARASELTERVRVEQTSKRYVADMEFHGAASIAEQHEQGFIDDIGTIPNAAGLREGMKADAQSVPAWLQVICMLVNTNQVKPADEPKEWKDLLDPKWKGKLLSDDMRAVGSGQTMFAVLHKTYGAEFLEKLKAQDLVFNRDLQVNSRRVARGENAIFIQQIIAFATELKGLPVKVILPADGCPYTQIRGAVLKNAPNRNAARVFINHFLDLDSQVRYGTAGMGTVVQGVAEKLTDPDAKRFAQVKLMGEVTYAERTPMLKAATEMFK
ncbi:MAG: Iron(III) transport system substrate-binding protein [Hyphomicrobiales bacterium]|nr:Iron(III) transport system substrate-binding protein [Hyphomicrobiales bacterium]